MNEEFEKWWTEWWKVEYSERSYAYYPKEHIKMLLEKTWNASREALKKGKKFECHVNKRQGIIFPDCILGTENEQFPRHSYCLYNEFHKLAKTDCPFWREVK